MIYEIISALVFSLNWRHNNSTKLGLFWVSVAYSRVTYYYLGDQTEALIDGKGLYYFSVETWREVQFGWFSRSWDFETTFKEIVCEDVDWINLALDKYCDWNKRFSFHEGVEFPL
jgi:hypothetical protein